MRAEHDALRVAACVEGLALRVHNEATRDEMLRAALDDELSESEDPSKQYSLNACF